jgi:FtsP/CotA-like multicopper oxidase with cupredoxin domain
MRPREDLREQHRHVPPVAHARLQPRPRPQPPPPDRAPDPATPLFTPAAASLPLPAAEERLGDEAGRPRWTRRQVLAGGGVALGLGLAGMLGWKGAWAEQQLGEARAALGELDLRLPRLHGRGDGTGAEAAGPAGSAGTTAAHTIRATLAAQLATIDLGGPVVQTWAYGDALPGPLLRGRVGDTLEVAVRNHLPQATTVHWHGLAIPNPMDGVPNLTQQPVAPGAAMTYRFVLPHAGTYWYHPHVGVQLDRGLYGPLIVDDPGDPGRYDAEFTVVLDDWLDGTGRTPDQVLQQLAGGMDMGMDGMDMGGTGGGQPGGMGAMGGMAMMRSAALGGDAGDVDYPHYLVNGRVPSAPVTLRARPGQRVRIRLLNAGADTAFRVALGGHRLTVTHTDGYPVRPVTVDSLLIAMGERYDLEVTVGDGAFPLVAEAEGKGAQGLAVVRTASGAAPGPAAKPAELRGRLLRLTDLDAIPEAALPRQRLDRVHDMVLQGDMTSYRWTINGRASDHLRPSDAPALPLRDGERLRLRFVNLSPMFHPMHVHGHTFQVRIRGGAAGAGPRKDTVIVRPLETVVCDLAADNPGTWMTHCHNLYHAESGMMALLAYRS